MKSIKIERNIENLLNNITNKKINRLKNIFYKQ